MKLSQILKIAGPIVGGLAALALVWKILATILQHPILIVILVLSAITYFAGVYFAKKGK